MAIIYVQQKNALNTLIFFYIKNRQFSSVKSHSKRSQKEMSLQMFNSKKFQINALRICSGLTLPALDPKSSPQRKLCSKNVVYGIRKLEQCQRPDTLNKGTKSLTITPMTIWAYMGNFAVGDDFATPACRTFLRSYRRRNESSCCRTRATVVVFSPSI